MQLLDYIVVVPPDDAGKLRGHKFTLYFVVNNLHPLDIQMSRVKYLKARQNLYLIVSFRKQIKDRHFLNQRKKMMKSLLLTLKMKKRKSKKKKKWMIRSRRKKLKKSLL